jgi:hypothetical protein
MMAEIPSAFDASALAKTTAKTSACGSVKASSKGQSDAMCVVMRKRLLLNLPPMHRVHSMSVSANA